VNHCYSRLGESSSLKRELLIWVKNTLAYVRLAGLPCLSREQNQKHIVQTINQLSFVQAQLPQGI